ncbi:adhesion G-protein coupled receptor G2 isoform X1 [Perca flavescens]|uniref:adhesion G-protein coupled receptor G2 isoform X1 n=1 Tax=Perca flavescens TaxID=8167 RepID=UPI00106E6A6E|nr:adhesion G-protein coupled receptor G2-like isoform X1 [Perca flavescens]XP_028450833.1 adhesion G-protein coupled receptor G2-like isoform X1 [Perca flavescens]XP_028450834.1 adhesion G-protein coupled receptor G2-like isoform X1 [Perca flavescens]
MMTATTMLQINNTTTASATTTLQSNNTAAATTTLESNNTTTAAATTTLQSNNTTTASATPTSQSNNTTTASATTTSQSNNTTTDSATPTSQSNNTTTDSATPTSQSNNTTTDSATPTSQSNNTTTASATPTSQGNNTTTDSATPTSQSNNTTTASATTTSQSNNTTTASTTTKSQSNNTTTVSASPTLQINNKTTAEATPTSQSNNKTTVEATPKSQSNNTTTVEATPTLQSNKKTTTAATTTLQSTARLKRIARQIGDSVTNTSLFFSVVSIDISTGLFQGINVSCTPTTATINISCSVRLQLKQSVPSCCILSTLCAASKKSSDIHVVGKRANQTNPLQNQCNNTMQEQNNCIYTGQAGASCEESGTAYVMPQPNSTHCGADTENNTCSCSAYCRMPDAYYTFQISIQDSNINISYISSVISKQPACPSSGGVSCPLSIIASEYKGFNVDCGGTATSLQSCKVILGFGHEVPICNVSAAMIHVLQSEKGISYDGTVTRVAICGNSKVSDNPLNSEKTEFVWYNSLQPATVCTIEASYNYTCQNGTNLVLQLEEQCVQGVFTTPSPNVTTAQPNTTTSSVNVTSSPLNTTAQALNATTTAANVTATAESQANALLELTRNVSELNSSQVNQLVSRLEQLLSGPTVSLALGNTSIHVVSNLLGASPGVLSNSSNRIIGIVDTVGLKLVLNGQANTLLSPDVALSVKPANGSNFQETIFSISDPNNVQVRGDPRLRRSVRTDPSIPQGSITLPSSLTQTLTTEQQRLASRVQFNFYQKSTVFQDRSLGKRKLNSGILGASVANLSITKLQDNVIVHLRNTEPIPANFGATCVFWDFTLNDGSGGWNPTGCFVQNRTDSETICGCNHLTSFAILLDLSKEPVTSRLQDNILTFITYIGCGVSAIFLSITLLTYLAFEKLRKDIPSKILIQLCLALLLLNLVFLVDAWLALYPDAVGLCISTAWFLHYFLLVTFTWMGLEAVHMYLAIVKVFNSYISHYMLKFSLVGWGVPMIVVIIVIAIDKNNYGLVSYAKFADGSSDDFCWLKNDIAFYVAVVVYFCIIFLFNLVMFVVVLVQLCRIKRQNPQNLQHRNTLQDVRSVMGITMLLGLTWGFAFFAWGPVNLPFMYLFTIFNSLQGFFIFVFHCAVKENVRKQWRTYLCCGRMRLAENSEWSRTATQKTVKKSSGTRLRSHHSSNSAQSNNFSSSSFLANDSSEQINGIGSPFEDRSIIADEVPRTDVVLNEINRQYRTQQA